MHSALLQLDRKQQFKREINRVVVQAQTLALALTRSVIQLKFSFVAAESLHVCPRCPLTLVQPPSGTQCSAGWSEVSFYLRTASCLLPISETGREISGRLFLPRAVLQLLTLTLTSTFG